MEAIATKIWFRWGPQGRDLVIITCMSGAWCALSTILPAGNLQPETVTDAASTNHMPSVCRPYFLTLDNDHIADSHHQCRPATGIATPYPRRKLGGATTGNSLSFATIQTVA